MRIEMHEGVTYITGRMVYAKSIAACKTYLGLPVYNPGVEKKILSHYSENACNPHFLKLLQINFDLSKNIQALWVKHWKAKKLSSSKILRDFGCAFYSRKNKRIMAQINDNEKLVNLAEANLRIVRTLISIVDDQLFRLLSTKNDMCEDLLTFMEQECMNLDTLDKVSDFFYRADSYVNCIT